MRFMRLRLFPMAVVVAVAFLSGVAPRVRSSRASRARQRQASRNSSTGFARATR